MSLNFSVLCSAATLLLAWGQSAHAETPRRDRQGDPLPPGAVARLGSVRLRHLDRIFDVAFSPDGKMLASSGADQRIRLWDAADGRPLHVLAGHPQWITNIAFSPNGKILASRGHDSTVRLWDVSTGRQISEPIRVDAGSVEFTADGKSLVLPVRPEGATRLWDIATRKFAGTLAPGIPVGEGVLAPDGRKLASKSIDPMRLPVLQLWDVTTKKELWRLTGRHPGAEWHVAFSPDSKVLALGCGYWDDQVRSRGLLKLFDASSGKELRSFPALGRLFDFVRFSPDGKYLASTGRDGPTILWDWKAADGPRRSWETPGKTGNLAFSSDSRRLAWGTGQTVRLIDLPPPKIPSALGGHTSPVPFVAFTSDGKRVVSVGEAVRVWDAASGKELRASPSLFTRCNGAALCPDGKRLIVSSREGTILWDLSTMKAVHPLSRENERAMTLALSPDGKSLIASTEKETSYLEKIDHNNGKPLKVPQPMVSVKRLPGIQVWNVDSGKEKPQVGKDVRAGSMAYSPDGTRFAAAQFYKKPFLRIWNVNTGTASVDLQVPAGKWMGSEVVCFSPNGKRLAAGGRYGKILIWDAHSGEILHFFGGHDLTIRAVVFSPDNKMLLSAGDDDALRLWDAATGKLLHQWTGHRAAVLAAAFSPDGKRIASASTDTTILLWDVASLSALARTPPPPPTEEELQGLWTDLASDFGHELIQRAMRQLVAAPKAAIAFLNRCLKPPAAPRDERMERLLADLDSDEFAVREKASRELAKMGKRAEGALRNALEQKPPAEKRRRVQALLDAIPRPKHFRRRPNEPAPEELRLLRIALVLDRIGTPEALDLLRYLAGAGELTAILNDRSLFSRETQKVKEALARRAKSSSGPRP